MAFETSLRRVLILVVSFAFLSVACAEAKYPNIETHLVEGSKERVLQGWKYEVADRRSVTRRIRPESSAFKGAVSWLEIFDSRDMNKSMKTALRAEGMRAMKVVASKPMQKASLKALGENHPHAEGRVFVLDGKWKGRSARAQVLAWYGNVGLKPGQKPEMTLYIFMAPTDEYKALGGFVVVAARWFDAAATKGEDMRIEGSLSPEKTVERFAYFVDSAAVQRIAINTMMGMMMQQVMQQRMQALSVMDEYGSSEALCSTIDGCKGVVDGGDGFYYMEY